MSLAQSLHEAGVRWTLSCDEAPGDGAARRRTSLLLQLTLSPGAAPVERRFPLYNALPLDHMLSLGMRQRAADHPAYGAWLESRGNVPVRLLLKRKDLVGVGEPMHVGLRKAADSKQSIITWNALHHMHSDDRVALWSAVADLLKKSFANRQRPLRRQLAAALRDCVEAVCRAQYNKQHVSDRRGIERERSPHERFALVTFQAACALTDIDEWMWGWLAYVVEDAPAKRGKAKEPIGG